MFYGDALIVVPYWASLLDSLRPHIASFDRRFRTVDSHVQAETLVAVGRPPAFPHELPDEVRHRARCAEILGILAQNHVAVVVVKRKVHAAEIREGRDLRIAQTYR